MQLHDIAVSLHHLVGITGAQGNQSWDGTQRGELFYRLVGGPVLAYSDGIVGKDIETGISSGRSSEWRPGNNR